MDFLNRFVLPLVQGGPVDVGRPIGPRGFGKLVARYAAQPAGAALVVQDAQPAPGPAASDRWALADLAARRRERGLAWLPGYAAPALGETDLRLCVALHNLLALGHPALSRSVRVRESVLGFSADLASVGAPGDATSAVDRHTLFALLARLARNEHEVRNWLGARTFVGREPPKRLLLWPKLRRVSVLHQERVWLRDIGVPPDARGLWDLLADANPLLDALDLHRLDPPVSWPRLATVLRFASLARPLAADFVGQGLSRVGEALALALFRFGGAQAAGGAADRASSLVFGVTFLSHLYWMHTLCKLPGDAGPALTALLAEAANVPTLLYPRDLHAKGAATRFAVPLAGVFATRIGALRQRARAGNPHLDEARATVAEAARALPATASGDFRASTL